MAPPHPLRAGVARTLITPDLGTYLAGYGHPFRGCKSVRDELTATALVLDDGATRVAICAVDQLAVNEHVVAAIRARVEEAGVLPGDHLLLACSHSHSSPVASAFDDTRKRQRAYVHDRFVPRVVEAIATAAERLAPATLHGGQATTDIAVNRREIDARGEMIIGVNPDGPVERGVGLLQVRDAAGAVLGTVVNVTCHPTTLGPKFKCATAEWPGEMRKVVEAATGDAPVLFLQGATGDINPEHQWGKGEMEALVRLGKSVGASIVAALPDLEPVAGVPLAAGRRPAELPLVPEHHPRTGKPLGHREALQRHVRVPLWTVSWLLERCYPWRTDVRQREDGAVVPMEVEVLRLGDCAVVGFGAEVFHEIAQAVKAASPAPALTLFAGYANGMIGYLPTEAQHALGGYEVDMAPYFYRLPGRLHPRSDAVATETSRALLADAFDG